MSLNRQNLDLGAEREILQNNVEILNKLKLLAQQEQKDERINKQLLELINHAGELRHSVALNQQLELTYSMLIGTLSPQEYMEKAREIQGETSRGWKIFGGLMMALGALLAVTGVAFLAVSVVALDPVIALGGMASLEFGFECLIGGAGFFSFSPGKKAAYKQMEEFYNVKKKALSNGEGNYTAIENNSSDAMARALSISM
ncbi:hypothetical protein [Legionella drancourtii]|uniref:Uncharacterized protein n=1 Tax=Legionella drancourtii LLAP12 TaxID=658187 RepID=G9ESH4_9GAMM|nr:hypothetical protein [Legionella drancourtii]EHL29955.1 hypothetical protein LDG_8248 [Legionella drancourtii LLAP12]